MRAAERERLNGLWSAGRAALAARVAPFAGCMVPVTKASEIKSGDDLARIVEPFVEGEVLYRPNEMMRIDAVISALQDSRSKEARQRAIDLIVVLRRKVTVTTYPSV